MSVSDSTQPASLWGPLLPLVGVNGSTQLCRTTKYREIIHNSLDRRSGWDY